MQFVIKKNKVNYSTVMTKLLSILIVLAITAVAIILNNKEEKLFDAYSKQMTLLERDYNQDLSMMRNCGNGNNIECFIANIHKIKSYKFLVELKLPINKTVTDTRDDIEKLNKSNRAIKNMIANNLVDKNYRTENIKANEDYINMLLDRKKRLLDAYVLKLEDMSNEISNHWDENYGVITNYYDNSLKIKIAKSLDDLRFLEHTVNKDIEKISNYYSKDVMLNNINHIKYNIAVYGMPL